MKLKEFNTDNCVSETKSTQNAAVGINMKTGSFRFNIPSYELMGLTDGDSVVFHQDEDEPADWYVEKSKEKGFCVKCKEKSGKGLIFFNTKLAKEIADSVYFKGTSGRCLIAGTPTKIKNRELWGIITSSLINSL